jgi:hypothetical protein
MIDETWYELPETAIKVYIKICPDCLRSATAPLTETMNSLNVIILETIGSRAQMDLIDYRWKE